MKRFFIGFITLILSLSLQAQKTGKTSGFKQGSATPVPPKTVIPPPIDTTAILWQARVDSVVKAYITNTVNCGVSIAVYRDKKETYYNYGEIKRGSKQVPTNKTIYEIGSISKTFTGILFGQAITDKKLNLNDQVKNHLGTGFDNLAYKDKAIELVHLANHTGRIHRVPFNLATQPNYDVTNPYKNYNKDMVFAYLKLMKPDTFPGVKNEYSNLGMALLGIIEEKAYSKTYEELISEFICRPLEMNDTKILVTDTVRFAKGYNDEGNLVPYWDLGALAGAGGIRSTSSDMMRFMKANIEEKNPAFKLAHQSTFNDNKNNVGLAWMITTTKKGNELIWHNGRTAGFSSFCGFIKSKNVAVVVLGNSSNPVDQIAIGILKLLQ
jgi:CubicO group peptidase (beta-lactamase class C family)